MYNLVHFIPILFIHVHFFILTCKWAVTFIHKANIYLYHYLLFTSFNKRFRQSDNISPDENVYLNIFF